MGKTIKQFDYQVTKMVKGDNLPFDPHVEIVLDHWTNQSEGAPIISPNLMSDDEVDAYIGQLKADLDAVAKRAKVALARAQDETKSIVSSRKSN